MQRVPPLRDAASVLRLVSTLLVLLGSFGGPAFAAPPEAAADEDEEGPRGELLERVRLLRMYALTEALELDETTAGRLFPYLKPGDEEIERLHGELRRHRGALRQLVRGTIEAKVAEAHLSAVSDLERRLADARSRQLDGLKTILTVEQRARFYVAQARFEERVRDMIREARQERRRRD